MDVALNEEPPPPDGAFEMSVTASSILAASVAAAIMECCANLEYLTSPVGWLSVQDESCFLFTGRDVVEVHAQLPGLVLCEGKGVEVFAESTVQPFDVQPEGVLWEVIPMAGADDFEGAPHSPLPLSHDALAHVLRFCPLPDLLAFRSTCRAFHCTLAAVPRDFWGQRFAALVVNGVAWPGCIRSMVQYVLSRILFVNLKLALNSLECVASCTPIILLAEDDLERRLGGCASAVGQTFAIPSDYTYFLVAYKGLSTGLYQAGNFTRRSACLSGAMEYPILTALRLFPLDELPAAVARRDGWGLAPHQRRAPECWLPIGEEYGLSTLWLNCNASSPSFGAVVATNRCTKEWFPLAMGFTTFLHWAADFILAKSEGTMPTDLSLAEHLAERYRRCLAPVAPGAVQRDPWPLWYGLSRQLACEAAATAEERRSAGRGGEGRASDGGVPPPPPVRKPTCVPMYGRGAQVVGMAWCGAVAEPPR